ncbi:flagellar biosynthetic protein FliR [Sinimarinibacterium sp. CAU 1509]|uniref:flagellar biosynthetic protein FliR n=1 Tax=Sinimarinibacterium sp. CAU 1509 TaxID=2562283 RepID=UPI0010AD94AC|nr:flagellar biosynthetic protein FliR [Sinimarinibacterium sp. CAU 1509]TJY62843.1 flagellar biosynthetic protein FliR [Sinimarinibacterium sp. CAU 1509]
MEFSEAQLMAWMQQYFWVFVRVGGVMAIAPVLGARMVSPRIRVLLSVLLTLIIAPLLPGAAAQATFGGAWLLTMMQQLLIGVSAGFVLLLVFEAVVLGAELVSYSMGLGFAQLADPLRGVTTPVLGTFLTLLTTLLFISLGGHLILIEMLARSFTTLPVAAGLGRADVAMLLGFGGTVFSGGLQLALPVVIALLVVNLAMGVISRSAPTLNLFAVGFPVTLAAGLMLIRAGMPAIQEGTIALFDHAWEVLATLLRIR